MIYQAAAQHGWVELLPLILATALAGVALVRIAQTYLLGPGDETPDTAPPLLGETELDRPAPRRRDPEPRSTAALALMLVLICLGIGLYPQPLLATVDEAIRGLAFIRAL